MRYDLDALKKTVRGRRQTVLFAFLSLALTAAIALTLLVLFLESVIVAFAAAAVLLFSAVTAFRLWKRSEPIVLFSRELRGVNREEHEFVTSDRRLYFAYSRVPYHKRPGNTQTERTPRGVRSMVYIETEEGDIAVLTGLLKKHTDIYEIGDTLFRPAGTRYPMVVSREVAAQPCPLCGTVNTSERTKCEHCGLGIIREE